MHVFPQLRKLEQKYQDELAVIGVHSAKFPTERETENIRMAILRYEIAHPVINDREFQVFNAYGCRAWPTLMFVDPQGRVLGKHEGEIPYDAFDHFLGTIIKQYDAQGLIDRRVLEYKRESGKESILSFPGKVLANDESGHVFISDSNHNRIIQATLDGEIIRTIGGITAGFLDGDFTLASFNHPQGMELDGDVLYVADTENHAIRRIDLSAGYVDTLVGTGDQAKFGVVSGTFNDTLLNSPWDLVLHNDVLYIAMAGAHQIWSLDLVMRTINTYAGSGRENLSDGSLGSATLAQPSGIDTDGQRLYFVDSETSSVRMVDSYPMVGVSTIVGRGLFEFGDVDGRGDDVRLQHPLGICWSGEILYVADTYNHKIKRICPTDKSSITLLGTGLSGYTNGPGDHATFYEPSGISAAAGKLYIADTNNHVIRVADMKSCEVSTFELSGL